MKRLTLLCGVFLISLFSPINKILSQTKEFVATRLDSVVVDAFRAGKNTPVTHSALNKEEITGSSPTHSIPMILSTLPSVVSSTEGGNGLGYSSIRIRGSEATRINVTLNGVSLNDGESQQLFWVNIPAFQNFLQDVQVVRGVGTSTNGSSAFGGSINLRTLFSSSQPYGLAQFGVGSYNTFLTTVGAGTGKLDRALSFDIRFSKSSGDGYIRNAKSDLKSLFATLGWHRESGSFRFNYIMGDQVTGITWEGISREQERIDRRYNPAGRYLDEAGNIRFYDNETDNYIQHHFQGHFTHYFSPYLIMGATLHFTKGGGYYENYKYNGKFSAYGISPQIIDGIEYSRSDLIVRQALDNYYTAANTTFTYKRGELNATAGVTLSYYDGNHNGELLWSMYNQNIPKNYNWYLNYGYKWDYSAFIKGEYTLKSNLILFADMQYRFINYTLVGEDKDFVSLDWRDTYSFINPKAGFTLNLSDRERLYASIAVGRKEPGRSDIKESIKAKKADEILPETVVDYELGYGFKNNSLAFEANIYFMEYRDQLVPTGRLSETGYIIKENVKNSYRRGIELMASYSPWQPVLFEGNLTLSTNKILNFTSYVDLFDFDFNSLGQESQYYSKTTISFSPSVVGMVAATLYPSKKSFIRFLGKYVGEHYMNNIQESWALIPHYLTFSLNGGKSLELQKGRSIELNLFVDNLFNNQYFNNGWIYSAKFIDGTTYVEEGIYPQSGINFTFMASFNF